MFTKNRVPDTTAKTPTKTSRSRWAAVGAAVAVCLGAGSIGIVEATVSQGERPILVQISPCRLVDTRAGSGIGPRQTPIGPNETYDVAVHGANGNCNIPVDAVGLSLNVTAVQATTRTNVRIFPTGGAVPLTSNLNPEPNDPPVPNAVSTGLDGAGMFSIYNEFGNVDIVVDINGYYEDHNHDDRYVQQTDMMWAVVNANGSLARSSDGVASSQRLDGMVPTGDYAVVFDRDVSECAFQVTRGSTTSTMGSGPQPGFAVVASWGADPENGVVVYVKDQNGVGDDGPFHLLVTC